MGRELTAHVELGVSFTLPPVLPASFSLPAPTTGFWALAVLLGGMVGLFGWLASARGKGWVGEWWVRVYLRRLDPAVYHCLHDLLIRDGKGGWTQIDHVVVSPFGFFVIETKNYGGWIFGTERDQYWTVSYNKRTKPRFLNPLRQNAGHIAALERLPDFPAGKCHNVVYLAGTGELKKGPLPGVVASRLADYIRGFDRPCLTPGEARDWAERLNAASASRDPVARKQHRAQVAEK